MRPELKKHEEKLVRKDTRQPETHHAVERVKDKARRTARKVHPRNR